MAYRYTEEQLKAFTAPPSDTEEQRMENAKEMIYDAIKSCDELKSHEVEVFAQGSYANNTNVRRESDVDICVMLRSTTFNEYPPGVTRENFGFGIGSINFTEYRELVKKALQDKFKVEHITDGNKSIKIDENSYHVKADAVPSFMYKNYAILNSRVSTKYIEGIKFYAKDGTEVINYPKQHIENGKAKNNSTGHRYKNLVRIMKHVKNDMTDAGLCNGDKISSFLIECLVYNVPNSELIAYGSFQESARNIVAYLYNNLKDGKASKWKEVSGCLDLFSNDRKWTVTDAQNYMYDVWNYMGY